MDPLSAAASIVGILAAAGKIIEILGPVVAALKDASKSATTTYSEVNNSRIILSALQTLLNNLNTASRKRTALIPIDQLVAVLTDGVILFSELEALVLPLGTSSGHVRSRIQWARREGTFASLISRLQSFKSSITLMLNILQSDSDLQANDSRRELLESNRELSRRLANLEDRFDASSILSRRKSHAWSQIHQQDDTGSKLAGTFFRQAHDKNSIPTSESSVLRFGFESDLEASRVYRKAQRDTVDFSFRSSIARTHTWSILSDLSLSDISAISVIALPMYSSDITNGYHYEFGAASPELPGGEPTAMPMEPGTLSKSDTRARDGTPPPATNPTTVSKTVSKGYAKSPYLREYKLLVVGGRGVDKSQLVTQFFLPHFIDGYDPTIEDLYRKMCVIDDEVAVLDVLDTAGQEEYSAMREQYMRVGEGFMLVYSITSRHSFQEIETFQQQVLRTKDKEYFPMVVVGNHCDMEDKREVSFKEGKDLALHMGCGFIEASSESRINVDNAFYDLVRDIRKYENRKSEEFEASAAYTQLVKQISRLRQRRKHWFRGIGITPSLEVINESGNLPYEDSTS